MWVLQGKKLEQADPKRYKGEFKLPHLLNTLKVPKFLTDVLFIQHSKMLSKWQVQGKPDCSEYSKYATVK